MTRSSVVRPTRASRFTSLLGSVDRHTVFTSTVVVLVVCEISNWQLEWLPDSPLYTSTYRTITGVTAAAFLVPAFFWARSAVSRGAPEMKTYALSTVLAAFLAAAAQWFFRRWTGQPVLPFPESGMDPLGVVMQPAWIFAFYTLEGGVPIAVYATLRRLRATTDGRRQAEIAYANMRRRKVELDLQAIQARIEPDFLFDTLTWIGARYEHDAVGAERLLDALIAYLRAALPSTEESTSTVDHEIAMARAYLEIVAVRSPRPLGVVFDIAESIGTCCMPPMLLLPLLNRIMPAPDDGAAATIRIGARVYAHNLALSVECCRAVPFAPCAIDTEIVETRLSMVYGERAWLMIDGTDRSLRAVLEVPHETSDRYRC